MYIKFILLAIGIILYLVLFGNVFLRYILFFWIFNMYNTKIFSENMNKCITSAANYLIVSSLNMNSNSDVV
jgi:hypothetical protein